MDSETLRAELAEVRVGVKYLVGRAKKQEEYSEKIEVRVRSLEKARNIAAGAVAVCVTAIGAVWKGTNG